MDDIESWLNVTETDVVSQVYSVLLNFVDYCCLEIDALL